MVVGNGMIAQTFSQFGNDSRTLIFASGVSNSLETDRAPFERERALLQDTRRRHPDQLFVYFGTCSVSDPDRVTTPYVRHKIEMENLVERLGGSWLILRLPLGIGPAHPSRTLAQFLYERISREENFDVWSGTVRYPLDVDDARRIAVRIIGDPRLRNRRINVALRAFPIADFVRAMEAVVGKPARCTFVPKGTPYRLECPETASIAAELGIDADERYLDRVLRKYYGPVAGLQARP